MTGIELDALNGTNMASVKDADLEAGIGIPDVNAAVGWSGNHKLKYFFYII